MAKAECANVSKSVSGAPKLKECIMNLKPFSIDDERKKIQATVTIVKVIRILGIIQRLATCLVSPNILSIHNATPYMAPQKINVQLAPCQIPMTKKVIRMLQ